MDLFYYLYQRRKLIREQTQRDVTNFSVAIPAHVSWLIEEADQVMRVIQSTHDTAPETFDFAP